MQAPVDNPLKQPGIIVPILALGGVVLVGSLVALVEERLAPDQVVGAQAERVHLRSLGVPLVARIRIRPEHRENARLILPSHDRLLLLSSAEVSEEKPVFAIAGEEEVLGLQVAMQDSH